MIIDSMGGVDEGPVFVWINGLRGPEPQKWAEHSVGYLPPDPTRPTILASFKISQREFTEPLDVLGRRYPCKTKSNQEEK